MADCCMAAQTIGGGSTRCPCVGANVKLRVKDTQSQMPMRDNKQGKRPVNGGMVGVEPPSGGPSGGEGGQARSVAVAVFLGL